MKIKNRFNWKVKGKGLTLKEVETIYETGLDIENYIDGLTDGKGQEWMNAYMGGTSVSISSRNRGMSIPGNILLPNWWGGSENIDKHYFAHELAHTWDSDTGHLSPSTRYDSLGIPHLGPLGAVNGPGDWLNTFIGGNVVSSNGCRNCDGSGGSYIPDSYEYTKPGSLYGNNSTADYLADSFANVIYRPETIPNPNVGLWIETAISIQASYLP